MKKIFFCDALYFPKYFLLHHFLRNTEIGCLETGSENEKPTFGGYKQEVRSQEFDKKQEVRSQH